MSYRTTPVNCTSWVRLENDPPNLGSCTLGLYGGTPSRWTCMRSCSRRTAIGEDPVLPERMHDPADAGRTLTPEQLVEAQRLEREAHERLGRWLEVLPSWQQALEYSRAKASRILGSVEPATRRLRILSCHGDEQTPPCPARAYSIRGHHYCSYCGCGEREEARLSGTGSTPTSPILDDMQDKFSFPYLACPLKMPGFSNAE